MGSVLQRLRRVLGGRRDRRGPVLCYFGHHKCATVNIHTTLGEVFAGLGLAQVAIHSPTMFPAGLAAFVSGPVDAFSYTNSQYEHVSDLARASRGYRGIHVIRDPRDVVVSGYFSHLGSHPLRGWPELAEIRPRLAELSREDGLLAEIDFIAELPTDGHAMRPIGSMVEWDYDDPNILELRFEDLAADGLTFYRRALDHYGLLDGDGPRVSADDLGAVVGRNSFEAVTGRAHGEEDRSSHYRQGTASQWREHFTPALTARFKEVFPGAVPALGYELDDAW